MTTDPKEEAAAQPPIGGKPRYRLVPAAPGSPFGWVAQPIPPDEMVSYDPPSPEADDPTIVGETGG